MLNKATAASEPAGFRLIFLPTDTAFLFLVWTCWLCNLSAALKCGVRDHLVASAMQAPQVMAGMTPPVESTVRANPHRVPITPHDDAEARPWVRGGAGASAVVQGRCQLAPATTRLHNER